MPKVGYCANKDLFFCSWPQYWYCTLRLQYKHNVCLINCHVYKRLWLHINIFTSNGSHSAMILMPSGFWLLVWEWIHAVCLHSLSIWESWTIWEELSWQLCGRGLGPNTRMVRYSLQNLQLFVTVFSLVINKNLFVLVCLFKFFCVPLMRYRSASCIKSTWKVLMLLLFTS